MKDQVRDLYKAADKVSEGFSFYRGLCNNAISN
jgi:hypothetical protein